MAFVNKVHKRLYPGIKNTHIPEMVILRVIPGSAAPQEPFPGIRRNEKTGTGANSSEKLSYEDVHTGRYSMRSRCTSFSFFIR